MSTVGQKEKATQNRVIKLFSEHLEYDYFGDWHDREDKNSNIEKKYVGSWLTKQGVSNTLIKRTFTALEQAAALGDGRHLYEANKDVYGLLRYGVKVKEGVENKLKLSG